MAPVPTLFPVNSSTTHLVRSLRTHDLSHGKVSHALYDITCPKSLMWFKWGNDFSHTTRLAPSGVGRISAEKYLTLHDRCFLCEELGTNCFLRVLVQRGNVRLGGTRLHPDAWRVERCTAAMRWRIFLPSGLYNHLPRLVRHRLSPWRTRHIPWQRYRHRRVHALAVHRNLSVFVCPRCRANRTGAELQDRPKYRRG